MSNPYIVEYCDDCGKQFVTTMLIRKTVAIGVTVGENLFPHSSYSTASWEVLSATDEGEISQGPFAKNWCDRRVVNIVDGKEEVTLIIEGGSRTFSGDGILRSVIPVNVSLMTSVLFGLEVGRHQENHQPGKTINITIGYYDGVSYYPASTYTVGSSRRCEIFTAVDDLPGGLNKASVYFYADITVDNDPSFDKSDFWWVDRFHLSSRDGLDPQSIPITRGNAVSTFPSNNEDGYQYLSSILCPGCYFFNVPVYDPSKPYRDLDLTKILNGPIPTESFRDG